jgi:hypothetical protein
LFWEETGKYCNFDFLQKMSSDDDIDEQEKAMRNPYR